MCVCVSTYVYICREVDTAAPPAPTAAPAIQSSGNEPW